MPNPPLPTTGAQGYRRKFPQLATKTILVFSKRDRTPVVADFTRFQSDREQGAKYELSVIDFVRLRSELEKYCWKSMVCPSGIAGDANVRVILIYFAGPTYLLLQLLLKLFGHTTNQITRFQIKSFVLESNKHVIQS